MSSNNKKQSPQRQGSESPASGASGNSDHGGDGGGSGGGGGGGGGGGSSSGGGHASGVGGSGGCDTSVAGSNVANDLHHHVEARDNSPTVDVHDEARLNADSDDGSHGSNDPGKMFIGGLSWQTTAENLRDYFGRFGEVNECMVMRDPATKRARGFGFITFVDPASVDKVLSHREHELDGKKIDPKVAFPKRTQAKLVTKTKKVFIGGLSALSTLEDMKHYFESYGKVEDAMLMFDKATQRHRGFGFITFDSDEVADKVCEIHFHEINGKMVECKKAQPKEVMLPVQLNKSRAAAARNLYGMPPEQLLAYASYIPNLRASLGNYLYPNMGNVFNLPTGYSGLNTNPPGTSSRPAPHQFDTSGIYNINGGAQNLVEHALAFPIQQPYHGAHNKAPY